MMNIYQMFNQVNDKETVNKDERFKKKFCISKTDKGQFYDQVCLHNKIVVYKNQFFVGDGFTGKVERLNLIFCDGQSVYKSVFKIEDEMEKLQQEIPEFEYIVCLEDKIFMLFRSDSEDLEVFELPSDARIGIFVEAANIDDNNLIYACYLYDDESKLFIKNVTTDSNTADGLFVLFDSFCSNMEVCND